MGSKILRGGGVKAGGVCTSPFSYMYLLQFVSIPFLSDSCFFAISVQTIM